MQANLHGNLLLLLGHLIEGLLLRVFDHINCRKECASICRNACHASLHLCKKLHIFDSSLLFDFLRNYSLHFRMWFSPDESRQYRQIQPYVTRIYFQRVGAQIRIDLGLQDEIIPFYSHNVITGDTEKRQRQKLLATAQRTT